jgi:ribosomal protein L16/L10AE
MTLKINEYYFYLLILIAFFLGRYQGIYEEGKITDMAIEGANQAEIRYLQKNKEYLELLIMADDVMNELEDIKAKHPKKYY